MPEPRRPISGESLPQSISPFSILKQAIRKVPPLKYALGIVGIAAALAIIKTLITDLRLALFGIILMLVLMTVLLVFAKLTSIASKEIKLPAIALLWFSLLITMTSASLLFTSVFFDWPINLKHTVVGPPAVSEPSPTSTMATKTTYLRGMVRDFETKQGIAEAIVEVEILPGKRFTTASDGGFSIEDIPAATGDSARVQVHKAGYALQDEYVALPGPKTIYLERKK